MTTENTQTRTKDAAGASIAVKPSPAFHDIAGWVPGLRYNGDPVRISAPDGNIVRDEYAFQDFLSDSGPDASQKRRVLLEQIRAVLALRARAKEKGITLAEAAREQAETYRRTVEMAWTSLLEKNRRQEEAVRFAALTLENMREGRSLFRNKIHAINASAAEIASETGRAFLAEEMSKYVDRPDPRASRSIVLVQGWVGSAAKLKLLAETTHNHRALLFTDAPAYDSLDKLRRATAEGGLLEKIPGEQNFLRHTVMLGNRGLARRRFQGRHAREAKDLYIHLSGPWLGMYIDNIGRGKPWIPPVGYQDPIQGVFGVELDLRLKEKDHSDLYLRHRINPAIPLAAGSDEIVVWGPDTLCKSGEVQIGVAVVEMLLVRYAEWIVKQYGILHDLEASRTKVERKLSDFMVKNRGADRMFLDGSRVHVEIEEKSRSLLVDFELRYREIAERAQIRLTKPIEKQKPGSFEISRGASSQT